MKVSKTFIKDFAYLANYYGWEGAELEDVKQQTRDSPELKRYWQRLAAAHRAGYEQTKQNNYERLAQWEQMRQAVPTLAHEALGIEKQKE